MTFKKVFLDANILVDIFDLKRVTHEESYSIYDYCMENNIKIYTSCDIATTVYYFTVKVVDRKKALDAMSIINQTINILPFQNIELEKTIKLMQEDSDYKDFEDTLQYIIAKDIGCEVIISNDKDFISKELPLYNPKEFVNNFLQI